MLKNLILSAAAAGVAAGVLTAVIQEVTTTPIILEAEKYENGVAPPEHAAAVSGQAGPSEAAEAPAPSEHEKWAPGEGIERTLFTTLGTTVAGVGFSLALLGAMALAGVAIGARTGLAFGVAGFAAVTLAPALGLPPEIPGSGAAALEVRQIWWFATAVATAAGLAGLLLARNMAVQIGGVVLLTLPHIIGAPRPETFISAAPAELAGHFAATSLAVTAIFWAVLGYASGAFYERLARPA
jgi:cobalt transporter subunit CbtA